MAMNGYIPSNKKKSPVSTHQRCSVLLYVGVRYLAVLLFRLFGEE